MPISDMEFIFAAMDPVPCREGTGYRIHSCGDQSFSLPVNRRVKRGQDTVMESCKCLSVVSTGSGAKPFGA